MGRRTVILVVALVIALVGSAMVYLYVRGADERAQAKQEPVEVLKAVAQIDAGESLSQAQAAGKLELQPVPREQLLEGVMDSVGESGGLVALAQVFPNEQVTTSKFGEPGEQDQLSLEKGQIAISTTEEGAQTTEEVPTTLYTLAVDQDEAQKIMFAANHGTLSFGLLNDQSKVKPGARVTETSLFR